MRDFYLKSKRLLLFIIFLSAATGFAQKIQVGGTVTDAGDKSTLPGVTVLEKGTVNGTVTDMDGKYQLTVNKGATIVFSFVGFKSVESVATESILDIQLHEMATDLSEIVVVGYGTQRKKSLTGSISKVTSENITEIPVSSFEQALQGKASGVQIISSSGMAGSPTAIRVRGIGSISASGDPLIVVDGMPITQENSNSLIGNRRGYNTNPLATINPNDIESVEILKDASAAAIYGSRGANGVILITTKRGVSKKPSFDVSYRGGFVKETYRLDLLNSTEWLQLYQEAYENDAIYGNRDINVEGSRPTLPGGLTWEEAARNNTDWQDEVLHTGFTQEANVSFNKSGEKLKSFAGIGFADNGSFIEGNDYKRFSGRVNLDYNPIPKLTTGVTSSFSEGINQRVEAAWAGGLGSAQSDALPIYPVYNADGSYFNGGTNPIRSRDNKDIKTFEYRTLANAYAQYAIKENLNVRIDGGIDYLDQREFYYENFVLNPTNPYSDKNNTYIFAWNGKAIAEYEFKLKDVHNFKVMGGSELLESQRRGRKWEYNSLEKPVYEYDGDPPDSLLSKTSTAVLEKYTFTSFFTRINYDYMGRYLVYGSLRSDGSSRFGKNNKWGYFPAFSLGWIASEEEFLSPVKWLSFLKVKAGIGFTGNAEIPNYQQYGTTSQYNNGIIYNGDSILYELNLENPDISWEKTVSYDAGVEFGLFKDRIYGEVAYYNKRTTDMLLQVKVATSSGWQQVWKNIGEMENKGWEVTLTSRNLVKKLKWETTFNIGFNKNKVLDIGTAGSDAFAGTGDTRVIVGECIGVNYLVRFAYVDPDDGRPVFYDKNGNLTKTYTPDDRVVAGKPYPDFIGGLTNSFKYKNFDLSFLFNFTSGNDIYDDAGKRHYGWIGQWNEVRDILNRWRKPGDVTDVPRLTLDENLSGIIPDRNTTEFLYDGSYIRLRELSVGYTFPATKLERLKLKALRVYFVGTNLLTFTNYPHGDPEIFRDMENILQKNLSPGVTYLTPPQAMTFSVGFNLTF
jgi:TonB-linked SusC/RagA family outer membrane protein